MMIYQWYNDNDEPCLSTGRNGKAITIGLQLWRIGNKYSLNPITSKKSLQNCDIEIPQSDFWALVAEMELQGLRPKENNNV